MRCLQILVEIKINYSTTIAHVLFTTSSLACDAVDKLHAHVYKGCLLSVTLKKRLDTLSNPVRIVKPSKDDHDPKGKSIAAPSHASRLIVRNIPFNATEQDLRAIFLPYGPIHSIHIPLDDRSTTKIQEKPDPEQAESSTAAARKPRTKGFAFVWMLSKKDAERALEGCNGMVMRAGTAESLVSSKQKKKKLVRLEKKRAALAASSKKDDGSDAGEAEEEEDEDMEKEEVDDKRATERVIAVDWALSKDKWKEEQAKAQEDVDMEDASGSDDSDSSASGDEDALGVHSGDDDSDDDGDSDDSRGEDDEEEERVKPELPPPETGTTLFVRNVPFNASEEDLRTLFESFAFIPFGITFLIKKSSQIPFFRASSIRPNYFRPCHRPFKGYWVRLFLEHRRCRQSSATE